MEAEEGFANLHKWWPVDSLAAFQRCRSLAQISHKVATLFKLRVLLRRVARVGLGHAPHQREQISRQSLAHSGSSAPPRVTCPNREMGVMVTL
jgi:hypothetical protein